MAAITISMEQGCDGARFQSELATALGAGIVEYVNTSSDGVTTTATVHTTRDLTPEEQDAVDTVAAAHVPLTKAQHQRTLAKDALGGDEPTRRATRAGLRVLYGSVVEMRQWCNALRQQLLAAGVPITVPALAMRTWEQALDAVRQQIDAE